uniref:RNA-directed DNA polymerase, eukaryota, reverse transcriptase zinc-binding domain protein n=1 Tax=Tanacetum cinerariifolium TaxID=118510 RepID=A0A699KYI6_TANCI|nr:RNA-directed DNA polymerase, eukaryota, reverse transcriptase zinc-binding domain protein [Tanacetum cinerariifolium]
MGSWKEQQTLLVILLYIRLLLTLELRLVIVCLDLSHGTMLFVKYRLGCLVGKLKLSQLEEDVWMGDLSLKCKFLRLFALETCKHVSFAMKLSCDSVASSFRRVPRGGIELEQYEDLVNCLATIHLAQMKERWAWSLTGDGDFSVKSVHNLLDDSLLNSNGSPTRWVKEIPIKINIFAWRV